MVDLNERVYGILKALPGVYVSHNYPESISGYNDAVIFDVSANGAYYYDETVYADRFIVKADILAGSWETCGAIYTRLRTLLENNGLIFVSRVDAGVDAKHDRVKITVKFKGLDMG